eukprot:309833_1
MSEDLIQIFVRVLTANRNYQTITVCISNRSYISHIIKELELVTGVPMHLIKLSHNSRYLDHNQSISFYDIGPGSNLNASVKSNEDIKKQIHFIDSKINRLKNNCKINMTKANSIHDLVAKWLNTQQTFDSQYIPLISQQLEYLNVIYYNHQQNSKQLTDEISYIKKDKLTKIDQCIDDLQNKIQHYQNKICELKEKIIFKESEKLSKQQELKTRSEILKDSNSKCTSTYKQIQQVKTRLKSHPFISDCFFSAFKEHERKYKEWKEDDVIEWLKIIENAAFSGNDKLMKVIHTLKICGKELNRLSNDILSLIDMSLIERKMILKNVERVMKREHSNTCNTCTICVTNIIDSVFIPCGHQSICLSCYQKHKNQFRNCPNCRKSVSIQKVYMSGFE